MSSRQREESKVPPSIEQPEAHHRPQSDVFLGNNDLSSNGESVSANGEEDFNSEDLEEDKIHNPAWMSNHDNYLAVHGSPNPLNLEIPVEPPEPAPFKLTIDRSCQTNILSREQNDPMTPEDVSNYYEILKILNKP